MATEAGIVVTAACGYVVWYWSIVSLASPGRLARTCLLVLLAALYVLTVYAIVHAGEVS